MAALSFLLLALSVAGSSASASFYTPDKPVSVLEQVFPNGANDYPLNFGPFQRTVAAMEPEQVRVNYVSPTEVTVTYSTGAPLLMTGPPMTYDPTSVTSLVRYSTERHPAKFQHERSALRTVFNQQYYDPSYGTPAEGCSQALGYIGTSTNPECGQLYNYTSGIIHHVPLKDLLPNTQYYYKVGDVSTGVSRLYSFKTLQPLGATWEPYYISIVADVGSTPNSTHTMAHIDAANSTMMVLLGDFIYADNYLTDCTINNANAPGNCQLRWDGWYRAFEYVFSKKPYAAVAGNHEIESQLDNPTSYIDGSGSTFVSYGKRYGLASPSKYTGPLPTLGVEEKYPGSYFTFKAPGVLFVALATYTYDYYSRRSPNPSNPTDLGAQVRWFIAQMEQVDRSETPHVVVYMHAPLYNTYQAHYKEHECMRSAFEHYFYKYGVNLIMAGHVHAYERTNKLYNYRVNSCGPVYITVGDAGNVEDLYTQWVDYCSSTVKKDPQGNPVQEPCTGPAGSPGVNQISNCDNNVGDYDACLTYNTPQGLGASYHKTSTYSNICPTQQPEWSAYREPDFGHGELLVQNTTHMQWTWHRNIDPETAKPTDQAWIVRYPDQCSNQQ